MEEGFFNLIVHHPVLGTKLNDVNNLFSAEDGVEELQPNEAGIRRTEVVAATDQRADFRSGMVGDRAIGRQRITPGRRVVADLATGETGFIDPFSVWVNELDQSAYVELDALVEEQPTPYTVGITKNIAGVRLTVPNRVTEFRRSDLSNFAFLTPVTEIREELWPIPFDLVRAGNPDSAASVRSNSIFGIRIGVDPKILAGGLLAVAAAILFINPRSEEGSKAMAASRPAAPGLVVQAGYRSIPKLPRASSQEPDTLAVEQIEPSNGEIHGTFRQNLLSRLQQSSPDSDGRSLFGLRTAPIDKTTHSILEQVPVVSKVEPVSLQAPPAMGVNYYGFVKSKEGVQPEKGLFLEGNNLMIGSEGEKLTNRYRVVQLTSTAARLEDVDAKRVQTLTLVPAIGSEKAEK